MFQLTIINTKIYIFPNTKKKKKNYLQNLFVAIKFSIKKKISLK